MTILTVKALRKKHACPDQVNLFKIYFGDKVNITTKLCEKHKKYFDWYWAVTTLLIGAAYSVYYDYRYKGNSMHIAFAKAYNSPKNKDYRKELNS